MHLILSAESVQNTIMTNENGQVLYKTSTPFSIRTHMTTFYKVVPNSDPDDMQDHLEAIGEIKWNLMGSSVIKHMFMGPDGFSYRWDMDFRVVRLSHNDATRQELMQSHRRSLSIIGPRRDPSLDVDPSLMHMLDIVILTFVYVEKLQMDKEKRVKRNNGGGGGGP
ncbi:hypothetical protein BKA82DRAFT_15641 [Pisolithus tinctorius]|uniref:DUF6593 domain-containing protein n=1 Tax=Pisolithus tinctorius Marx 270 TaxID=870435 RepID=A0A0C3K2J7_PISTI|nr:hypothetical protein BKA82DRAFT_15641 [Pisolithus tinctorius]KIO03752.1 hypothetical protein M404DRAFT_15641 [Pisolithus tinctorius Marx 270]